MYKSTECQGTSSANKRAPRILVHLYAQRALHGIRDVEDVLLPTCPAELLAMEGRRNKSHINILYPSPH